MVCNMGDRRILLSVRTLDVPELIAINIANNCPSTAAFHVDFIWIENSDGKASVVLVKDYSTHVSICMVHTFGRMKSN